MGGAESIGSARLASSLALLRHDLVGPLDNLSESQGEALLLSFELHATANHVVFPGEVVVESGGVGGHLPPMSRARVGGAMKLSEDPTGSAAAITRRGFMRRCGI